MLNSGLIEEREPRLLFYFHFKFIAVSQIQVRHGFGNEKTSMTLKYREIGR